MRKVLIQQATPTMLTILTINRSAIIPQSATRVPLRSPTQAPQFCLACQHETRRERILCV